VPVVSACHTFVSYSKVSGLLRALAPVFKGIKVLALVTSFFSKILNIKLLMFTVRSQASGHNLLYFGCRRREQDFLYRWQLGTFHCLVKPFYHHWISWPRKHRISIIIYV